MTVTARLGAFAAAALAAFAVGYGVGELAGAGDTGTEANPVHHMDDR